MKAGGSFIMMWEELCGPRGLCFLSFASQVRKDVDTIPGSCSNRRPLGVSCHSADNVTTVTSANNPPPQEQQRAYADRPVQFLAFLVYRSESTSP